MDPTTAARDREIVELYWQRSERAIQLTHERYGGLCTRVAMNILGDPSDAEECVNDTYLKAWKSIPPERPRALGAFLTRITRNLALDRYRTKRRQKRDGEFTVMLSAYLITVLASSSTSFMQGNVEIPAEIVTL